MPNGLELGVTYFHGDYDGSLTSAYNQELQLGGTTTINGYYYYKQSKIVPEYHTSWRLIDSPSTQAVVTKYSVTQVDVDNKVDEFFIGCVPNVDSENSNGYDVTVKINNVVFNDWQYITDNGLRGFIKAGSTYKIAVNDFIEIRAVSDQGLLSLSGISKHELPLSWGHNAQNQEITTVSSPEYLEQFKQHMQGQKGFAGDSLASNNYENSTRTPGVENKIIQTNQDVLLGAFLLDDTPANLVDALRFSANEYEKYKNRLVHEIEKYYNSKSTTGLSTEFVLEQVLRNVTTFKIGKDVFDFTYILPFGDNYLQQDFTAALDQVEFTLTSYADLDDLENSLLIYLEGELLTVDKDYTFSSYNPITVRLNATPQAGQVLCTKLYNANRDSVQCPPTPSTMGILPLYQPCIEMDNSFAEPIEMLVGHDGSRTKTFGDFRDTLMLEFEKRIYNSAKAEFRNANSLPEYNVFAVRAGAFRNTGYSHSEFNDLLRHYFSAWSIRNNLDSVTNEYYDREDNWTWNYGDASNPGYWRGWYEYYYDTVRPNTHPWEMLGFTEEPTWWKAQYPMYAETDEEKLFPLVDYSSNNTAMWKDLELGIIRQGPRENVTNDRYKSSSNLVARPDLSNLLPVDAQGNLIAPADIVSTKTTTLTRSWSGTAGTHLGYKTESFRALDGVTVSHDSSNIYITTNNISSLPSAEQKELKYNLPIVDATLTPDASDATVMTHNAVGVAVNGEPLYNITDGTSYKGNTDWKYNIPAQSGFEPVSVDTQGTVIRHVITPDVLGLDDWDSTTASPVVGWSLDGYPIYGPYGYSDPADSTSSVVRIQSSWSVDTRTRGTVGTESTGPQGMPTGQYINDFVYASNTGAYADAYNMRYAVTPDSPTVKIWHYVVTVDADHNPVFPYAVGGGVASERWQGKFRNIASTVGQVSSIKLTDGGGLYTVAPIVTISGDGTGATATATINSDGKVDSITITNSGTSYSTVSVSIDRATGDTTGVRAKAVAYIDEFDTTSGKAYVNPQATTAFSSVLKTEKSYTDAISNPWKFNDGAPVENAWKYTSIYPFAITEALLLAKPGRFASVFSDPTKLLRPAVNKGQLLSKATRKRWKFTNANDFRIHGDVDNSGKTLYNIGYTQFIDSWLKFQGLDTVSNLVNPLRSLNMKLAHRMSGYVDKDTLTARTDQYSNSGNASSLIIPKENVHVALHSSNYKSRNSYSGIVIVKTATGYRVRGFDKNRGYFEALESVKRGASQSIEVGGDPVPFVSWEANKDYPKGTIVQQLGNFFKAPVKISGSAKFERSVWTPLASLPQTDAAKGIVWQNTTNNVIRVPYETEYTDVQDVFDLLISIGRYNEQQGFDFGGFDSKINDIRNWLHSAKQFLFWTTGKWEIGNTIELSPCANKLVFEAPQGFIAKINRTEREQFSLLNENGEAIEPTQCEIFREDNRIEIVPPQGSQIYSAVLFTKEIEHAMVFDSVTNFNDVIYNDLLDQKHTRIKIKTARTANWDGRFASEGFIIDGDELKPNLDNMAESLGRYHELGFIPVEKQLYEASRALFGYQQRDYLSELDIDDDTQFEFYQGILQNKGTSSSLTKISQSGAVVQGNVSVFDEWALRVGDFGDTDRNQSIELKLSKNEMTQDPQMVSLQFPQDITNVIDRIDVLDARYAYKKTPTIEISEPLAGGTQATATATLDASTKRIASISVTNPGSNYPDAPVAKVVASNVVINTSTHKFGRAVSQTDGYLDLDTPVGSNAATAEITIRDNTTGTQETITVLDGSDPANLVSAVNNSAVNVTAAIVRGDVYDSASNAVEVKYSMVISGVDFTLSNVSNFGVQAGRYRTIQAFAIENTVADPTGNETTPADITLSVNGTAISNEVDGTTMWTYHAGSTNTFTTSQNYPQIDTGATLAQGEYVYPLTGGTNVTFTLDTEIEANALELNEDTTYKFVEVYINGVRIRNAVNSTAFGDHDNDSSTAWQQYVTSYNTLFNFVTDPVTGNATQIVFPNINRLPDAVKSAVFNPPSADVIESQQRQIEQVLASGAKIEIVEIPRVELAEAFTEDKPGASINIKVTTIEGIAARIGTRRTFEITPDNLNDDMILIDIDDSQRFVKKPHGIRQDNLWPTTSEVDYKGIDNGIYPRVKNAGYVDIANVNFQAFDLTSLPSLYNSNRVLKPGTDDLVHVAVSEDDDWNVYKLQRAQGGVQYVKTDPVSGKADLYTDYSLFNYLDTNELGRPNTGKYLDYFLTLKNANLSDNLVVWTNESIVQEKSTNITDFEAPRMVTARIASIKPQKVSAITGTEPYFGKKIYNLSLTPEDGTDVVTVSGNIKDISNLDQIELVKNIGTEYTVQASISGTTNSNIFDIDPIGIDGVNIINPGTYSTPPILQFTPSPSGDNAVGVALLSGGLPSTISIRDGGEGYRQDVQNIVVTVSAPDKFDGTQAQVEITSVNSDGTITGINVINQGSGYTSKPDISIDSGATKPAKLDYDFAGSIDSVVMLRRGSGYGTTTPTVTVTPSSGGAILTPYKTTISETGIHQNYVAASNDATKVTVVLKLNPVDDLKYRVEPALNSAEKEKLDLIEKHLVNLRTTLHSYNPLTGVAQVKVPAISDSADVLQYTPPGGSPSATVENIRFMTVVRETYDDPAPFTVTNVTNNTFQIERPGTGYSTAVEIRHLNKTKVIAPAHGFITGDVVRISCNVFRGMFEIEAVLSPSEFVIASPYTPGFEGTGTVYGKGIKITTVSPHTITPIYVESQKRIAVHFAEPKTFNKVYRMSSVTPNEIYINGNWAPMTGEAIYFETKKGAVSAQTVYDGTNQTTATNIVPISTEGRLIEKLVTYSGNAQPVPPQFVSERNNNIIISPQALPTQTIDLSYPSVDVTVIRQRHRQTDRYPIVTTVDHDVVNINGSLIKLDNYNNPSSIASSINRQIDLRKQFIRKPKNPQHDEGLKVGFVMAKDPFQLVLEGKPSRSISDYGPYIRDRNLIAELSGGELLADKDLVLVTGEEKPLDSRFNKGEKLVGPYRGLEYTDEQTGIAYIWNADMDEYMPIRNPFDEEVTLRDPIEKPMLPENHVDGADILAQLTVWSQSTENSNTVLVYPKDSIITKDGRAFKAVVDVYQSDNNKPNLFTMQANSRVLWREVTNGDKNSLDVYSSEPILAAYNDLIIDVIPGNGTGTSGGVGVKQSAYNMSLTDTFTLADDVTTVELGRYKLGVSPHNLFEVYQAVQNTDHHIYYILVDRVNPENAQQAVDYYNTVSYWALGTDYAITDFYYINERVPTVDGNRRITDADDPIRRRFTATAINIGAVEPAAYVGKQLIPEPFAVQNGNGSDAIANALTIPGLKVDGDTITVEASGHNRFFMWTPGLTPGKWTPQKEGPGSLIGNNGSSTTFGYGRGYYELNDGHHSDYYPQVSNFVQPEHSGWSRTMPRFLYSSKFTVEPEVDVTQETLFISSIDGSRLTFEEAEELGFDKVTIQTVDTNFVDQADESEANTGLRPEEIFVACFWTEPHVYRNQWVDVDYNQSPPVPVVQDYNGTVTRVKYIRLTELPPNAYTRRLIPDTGWAQGLKQWNNRPVDLETLPLTDESIAEIFNPSRNVNGGSTGDSLDGANVTLTLTGNEDSESLNPNNTALVDSTGDLLINTGLNKEVIPVTELGPVINGDVFSGLPGPCVSLGAPENVGGLDDKDCTSKTTETRFVYLTNEDLQMRGGDITFLPENEDTLVTAGNFVVGNRYRIESTGDTDFTTIGTQTIDGDPIANSNRGTEFYATGAGTGTGTAYLIGITFNDNGRFDPHPWNDFSNGNQENTNFPYNYDNANWGFISMKIAGEHPFRVYFDNMRNEDFAHLGITIVQSTQPYFAASATDLDKWGKPSVSSDNNLTQQYWENPYTTVLKSTQVSSDVINLSGEQIKQYGIDDIDTGTNTKNVVNDLMGYSSFNQDTFYAIARGEGPGDYSGSIEDFSKNSNRGTFQDNGYNFTSMTGSELPNTETPTRVLSNHIWRDQFKWNKPISQLGVAWNDSQTYDSNSEEWFAKQYNYDIGVRGIGVLDAIANCKQGEYITVFFRGPVDATRDDFREDGEKFQATIEFVGEKIEVPSVEVVDPGDGEVCNTSDGSFGWSQGAIKTTMYKGSGSAGYFGSFDTDGETWDRRYSKNRNLKRITGTTQPTTQTNCKLDNIYFPYQTLPNPYKSTGGASTDFSKARNITTGEMEDQTNIGGWGSWQHNNYRAATLNGVSKYTSTAKSMSGRITIPQDTTIEYKGYFRAPYTGEYDFKAYSDDGIWVWVSSEPTTLTSSNGRPVRSGVNDKGFNHVGQPASGDANDPREYFKEDGYDPSNPYAYHRQNALNSNGWLTSDDNVKHLLSAERVVMLNEGDFYFVRIITGNKRGPGFAELKWFVQTSDPVDWSRYLYEEDQVYDFWQYERTGIGGYEGMRQTYASGHVTFGGKVCIDDQPPGNPPPPGEPPPSGSTNPPPTSSTGTSSPPTGSPPPSTGNWTFTPATGTTINTAGDTSINIAPPGEKLLKYTTVVAVWKDFDDMSLSGLQYEANGDPYSVRVYANKIMWNNWYWAQNDDPNVAGVGDVFPLVLEDGFWDRFNGGAHPDALHVYPDWSGERAVKAVYPSSTAPVTTQPPTTTGAPPPSNWTATGTSQLSTDHLNGGSYPVPPGDRVEVDFVFTSTLTAMLDDSESPAFVVPQWGSFNDQPVWTSFNVNEAYANNSGNMVFVKNVYWSDGWNENWDGNQVTVQLWSYPTGTTFDTNTNGTLRGEFTFTFDYAAAHGTGTATTTTTTTAPPSGGAILELDILDGGANILHGSGNTANATYLGSTGSGAQFDFELSNGTSGSLVGMRILNGGSGYVVGDRFRVSSVSFGGQLAATVMVTRVGSSNSSQIGTPPSDNTNNVIEQRDTSTLNTIIQERKTSPYGWLTESQWQDYKAQIDGTCSSVGYQPAGGKWLDCQLLALIKVGACPPNYANRCDYLKQYSSENWQDFDSPVVQPAILTTNVVTGNQPVGGGVRDASVRPASQDIDLGVATKTVVLPDGSTVVIPQIDIMESFGNNSQPGQPMLSGFNFMPYSMKKKVRQNIVNLNQFSFGTVEMTPENPIANGVQRTTGGLTVPLGRKLTTVAMPRPALENSKVVEQPWSKDLPNSTLLNRTSRFFDYNPEKISTVATVGGKPITNVVAGAKEFIKKIGPNGEERLEFVGPASETPGLNVESNSTPNQTAQTGRTGLPGIGTDAFGRPLLAGERLLPSQLAPADLDIKYNQRAQIDITPQAIDNNGNYFASGPTASVQLRQPTPEVTIDGNNLIGIEEGTELLVNNKKIIIRGQGLVDIKTQVNCAHMGVNALIDEETNTLTLASCNDSPINFGNGCGGGTWKQVGDFHVNRGFDQDETESQGIFMPFINPYEGFTTTTTTSTTVNTNTNTSTTSSDTVTDGGGGGGQDEVDPEFPEGEYIWDYERDVATGELRLINYTGKLHGPDSWDKEGNPMPEQYRTPSRIPLLTKRKSTGGSNYRIGDRLRLIGGTPVTMNRSPIAKICIESAGSGYKRMENIRIVFNADGQAPGLAAQAVVTELDELGGIAEITMVNNGASYDPENPPKVTITEVGRERDAYNDAYTNINVAYPAAVTVNAGDFINLTFNNETVDANGVYTGDIEVQTRTVRALSTVEFGRKHNELYTSADIAWNEVGASNPTITGLTNPPRSITVTQTLTSIPLAYRPNPGEKVMVTSYPGTNLNDFTSTATAANFVGVLFNSITVENANGLIEDMAISYAYEDANGARELTYLGIINSVDTATGIITVKSEPRPLGDPETPANSGSTVDTDVRDALLAEIAAGSAEVFFGRKANLLMTVPGVPTPGPNGEFPVGLNTVGNDGFVLHHAVLENETVALNYFGVTNAPILMEFVESWDAAGGDNLVEATPAAVPFNEAKLSAIVGELEPLQDGDNPAEQKLKRMPAGPMRVAKFIVTDVDAQGSITGLRVIDRGLYKEFPADLTMGLPLEYDYESEGAFRFDPVASADADPADLFAQRSEILGIGDPMRNNILYGGAPVPNRDNKRLIHPEYQGPPFVALEQFLDENKKSDDPVLTAMLQVVVDKVNDPLIGYHKLTPNEKKLYDDLINEIVETVQFSSFNKHPDWQPYPEFKAVGTFDDNGVPDFIPYSGTPGAYDPTTWVIVDLTFSLDYEDYQNDPGNFAKVAYQAGNLIRKTKAINFTANSPSYGQYLPNEVAGGTGARVFLTAQEVPNCTEKGTAQEALDLPDQVTAVDAPRALTRAMNDAFQGAGYKPDDIKAVFRPIGDLGEVTIVTPSEGVEIDTPTLGVLDKLPLPIGTFNTAMLCIDATLEKTNADGELLPYTDKEFYEDVEALYNEGDSSNLLGVLDLTGTTDPETGNPIKDTYMLNIVCAEKIEPVLPPPPPPGTEKAGAGTGAPTRGGRTLFGDPELFGLNDNNSIFGDGKQVTINELYKYNIQNIFGQDVKLQVGEGKQTSPVLYFESKRFNQNNLIEPLQGPGMLSESELVGNNIELFQEGNAWVDSYSNARWNKNMPNFIEGGWAYFENGVPQRWQTPMIDTNYINNAMLYDPETGSKTFDYDLFDPFKGVLPGFIQNEVHYISDVDPVSYNNARTNFGRNNIGKVWWDTSTVRYTWYEQGDNRSRVDNWGKAVPGSTITVCEWVESEALPSNWNGDGIPRWTDRYTSQRLLDPQTGEYKVYYYYWIMNRSRLDDRVVRELGRKHDLETIGKYIADPVGYGLNILNFVSNNTVSVNNVSNIREQDSHLQININKNSNPDSIDHTAWKLMREGDNNSIVPDYLSDKLIDSLCAENIDGQPVPDPVLSEVEAYGIQFRPRQSMFKDIKQARRTMVSVLNRILADTRLNSQYPTWDINLPTARAYIETTTWYEQNRVDPLTNEVVRYNDNSKPIYSVNGVSELRKLQDVADGTVIQVQSKQNDIYQLWMYVAVEDDYKLIAVENDTVQLRSTVYTDESNPTLASELRLLLNTLRDNVFVNTVYWNELFFELMKYAYTEQGQLSWAFKTSYLFVEKEEDDLVQFTGFRPDNFQKVLDYMNEVKPFNAKIREYKDGKRTPVDLIGQNSLSDYDKPPYVDEAKGEVRILDINVDNDANIMATSPVYVNYHSAQSASNIETTPIRRSNTQIVFDRTHWQFTQPNWDIANISMEASIGYNMANLSVLTDKEVESNADVRAVDRLFKFDLDVKATFAREVNTYFSDSQAFRNIDIIGNGTMMAQAVADGQMKNTLAVLKDKVGGNFRGETLNAGEYSRIVDDADYFANVQTLFGFDSAPFDENTDNDNTVSTDNSALDNYGPVTTVGVGDAPWDRTTEIVSYEGIFASTQGNVTLRKNNENYEGFDGVTFQKVMYGEERPEELAVIDPLESLIMTVTTSPFSRGAAGLFSVYDSEIDVANADVRHSTISLMGNIIVNNGGIGYVNPAVVITDPSGSGAGATATATVDSNGTVTAVNVTSIGDEYSEISISLSESLEATLTADVNVFDKTLQLDSNANVRVGQAVIYSTRVLGIIESVTNNTITLNQLQLMPIQSGEILDFEGRNFAAGYDIIDETDPVASVFVNKAFIDQHENLSSVYTLNTDYFVVPGNLIVYDFQNSLAFPEITNTTGVDPLNSNNYFVVDTANGWDTANENGEAGSFDVADTLLQERVVSSIPYGQEVVFRQHQTLFGETDYLRISDEQTTSITSELKFNSTEITLLDGSFIDTPTSLEPGSIWVGDERINFGRKDGNTLSLLTRGAYGTTPQDHAVNTPVYNANRKEYFNHINPQANVWLDIGTRYSEPEGWDEVEAGLNGVIESLFGNEATILGDDVLRAWDEYASGNITTSTVGATVTSANATVSTFTLSGAMVLTEGEAIRITDPSNVANTEVVAVTSVLGSDVSVQASYNDTLDANIFVVNGTINVTSFNYGSQSADDKWDSAAISGQTAISLSDRANADFTSSTSIMRFLHKLV